MIINYFNTHSFNNIALWPTMANNEFEPRYFDKQFDALPPARMYINRLGKFTILSIQL